MTIAGQIAMREAAAKAAKAHNAVNRNAAEKRICHGIAAEIRQLPIQEVDHANCILCAGACRGHSLASSADFKPEPGSAAWEVEQLRKAFAPRSAADLRAIIRTWLDADCDWGSWEKRLDRLIEE
jgi:hypothetical protein